MESAGGGGDGPNPPRGFIVCTEAYVICGLRRSESDFLVGVLLQLGIELVNLAPNSILILAIFQHLCEVFLGFTPHLPCFSISTIFAALATTPTKFSIVGISDSAMASTRSFP